MTKSIFGQPFTDQFGHEINPQAHRQWQQELFEHHNNSAFDPRACRPVVAQTEQTGSNDSQQCGEEVAK